MTQAPALAAPKNSRLIDTLARLTGSDTAVTHSNLADSLGRLIDLTDSISLAESLRGLRRLEFAPSQANKDSDLRQTLLAFQAETVAFIITSFGSDADDQPFKLPRVGERLLTEEAAFQLYHKFYALHQSEMEFRILKLRTQVHQQLSGHSRELAQLAALDSALGDTLAAYTRKVFAAIPRILAKRFEQLRHDHLQAISQDQAVDDPQAWTQAGGWLHHFYRDMQELLLAELDVRLQLVLGLIEAHDIEVEKTP